uniref:Uncharacterized protein n=1 Tax=Oryza nivara TaxID=4536 RepID=A0A0E0G6Y3_ORYNI
MSPILEDQTRLSPKTPSKELTAEVRGNKDHCVFHDSGKELRLSRDNPYDCSNHHQLHRQRRERYTRASRSATKKKRWLWIMHLPSITKSGSTGGIPSPPAADGGGLSPPDLGSGDDSGAAARSRLAAAPFLPRLALSCLLVYLLHTQRW